MAFIIPYVCMIVFFRIRFCNFRESCYFGEVFWIVVFSATGIVIVLRSYLIVFCCVHVLKVYLFVSPCVFLCFLLGGYFCLRFVLCDFHMLWFYLVLILFFREGYYFVSTIDVCCCIANTCMCIWAFAFCG